MNAETLAKVAEIIEPMLVAENFGGAWGRAEQLLGEPMTYPEFLATFVWSRA
jgi:hypothetical protein